jgi:hypothetical protein
VSSRIPSLYRGYNEHTLCVRDTAIGGFEPRQQPPCNLGYAVRVYERMRSLSRVVQSLPRIDPSIRPLLEFVLGLLTPVCLAGVEGEDESVGQKDETAAGSHGYDPTRITIEDLVRLHFFEGVPGWALERLAGSATIRRLEQGALVVRQNDEARAVYFLLSGAVQILVYFEGVGDLLMGVHREPGSLIAWSAFRAPYHHTSSMRCEEPTELMRMPREAFEELFEEDPYLGYLILKKVAAAMDNRLEGAVTFLESSSNPVGEL